MLQHADIWRAIDLLAERHGLSASGLAKKAGLSSTLFNPSKRVHNGRNRWPSTESVALILRATNTDFDSFVALTQNVVLPKSVVPLLGYAQAGRDGFFDEAGFPTGQGWDEISMPSISDTHVFALEISGKSMEPVYREGDRLIISPAETPRRGDRVVVRTKTGEVLAKQLGRETSTKVELVSLNEAFEGVTFARREIDWIYRIMWVSQ